jgi:predicted pyridoxine 5'-phosphate oxidase superfamily flavin-nucleotide-binding protein
MHAGKTYGLHSFPDSAYCADPTMSRLYNESHRVFQDHFDSRRMADRIEQLAVALEFTPEATAFIESRNMFFLSTVDDRGRPTVSYKGGDAGFVRIIDATTLAFPSYDGNGMYYSMGNIAAQPEVGLLFIDFEKPHRVRVQGTATVSSEDPLRSHWKEAELVVRVTLTELWQNCPRYIHRMTPVEPSRYVPRAECQTPVAGWKRIDLVQDVLRDHEVEQVLKGGGTIGIEEWMGHVASGDPKA